MPSLVPDLVKKRCKTISADAKTSVATTYKTKLELAGGLPKSAPVGLAGMFGATASAGFAAAA